MSSLDTNIAGSASTTQGGAHVRKHGRGHHQPDPAAFDRAIGDAGQSLGLSAKQTDALRSQIKDALSSLGSGGSANRGAERAAIDKVLADNGIDSAKFGTALRNALRSGRVGSAGAGIDPDGDGDEHAGGAQTTGASSTSRGGIDVSA